MATPKETELTWSAAPPSPVNAIGSGSTWSRADSSSDLSTNPKMVMAVMAADGVELAPLNSHALSSDLALSGDRNLKTYTNGKTHEQIDKTLQQLGANEQEQSSSGGAKNVAAFIVPLTEVQGTRGTSPASNTIPNTIAISEGDIRDPVSTSAEKVGLAQVSSPVETRTMRANASSSSPVDPRTPSPPPRPFYANLISPRRVNITQPRPPRQLRHDSDLKADGILSTALTIKIKPLNQGSIYRPQFYEWEDWTNASISPAVSGKVVYSKMLPKEKSQQAQHYNLRNLRKTIKTTTSSAGSSLASQSPRRAAVPEISRSLRVQIIVREIFGSKGSTNDLIHESSGRTSPDPDAGDELYGPSTNAGSLRLHLQQNFVHRLLRTASSTDNATHTESVDELDLVDFERSPTSHPAYKQHSSPERLYHDILLEEAKRKLEGNIPLFIIDPSSSLHRPSSNDDIPSVINFALPPDGVVAPSPSSESHADDDYVAAPPLIDVPETKRSLSPMRTRTPTQAAHSPEQTTSGTNNEGRSHSIVAPMSLRALSEEVIELVSPMVLENQVNQMVFPSPGAQSADNFDDAEKPAFQSTTDAYFQVRPQSSASSAFATFAPTSPVSHLPPTLMSSATLPFASSSSSSLPEVRDDESLPLPSASSSGMVPAVWTDVEPIGSEEDAEPSAKVPAPLVLHPEYMKPRYRNFWAEGGDNTYLARAMGQYDVVQGQPMVREDEVEVEVKSEEEDELDQLARDTDSESSDVEVQDSQSGMVFLSQKSSVSVAPHRKRKKSIFITPRKRSRVTSALNSTSPRKRNSRGHFVVEREGEGNPSFGANLPATSASISNPGSPIRRLKRP